MAAIPLLMAGCAASSRPADANGPVRVLMTTTAGEIELELDGERAPVTVANFLMYAERREYDGTIFHRVIPTFVVQGGGYTPDFTERNTLDGRPDRPIRNEWGNGLRNERGTIAMARETEPDSATRQFFINVADNPRLDTGRPITGNAGYAVFGRVVRGMETIDRIKDAPTGERADKDLRDVPLEPVVILTVRRVRE